MQCRLCSILKVHRVLPSVLMQTQAKIWSLVLYFAYTTQRLVFQRDSSQWCTKRAFTPLFVGYTLRVAQVKQRI
jgi:hypothetical protein